MLSYIKDKDTYSETVLNTQRELSKAGYLNSKFIDGYFNLETESAIKSFQSDNYLTVNGKIDSNVKSGLLRNEEVENTSYGKYNRSLYTTSKVNPSDNSTTIGPQDPFFNDNKENELRKASVDIHIKYANNGTATIEDVSFRSIGRQFNSNGDAVCEIYEFIGRDLKE